MNKENCTKGPCPDPVPGSDNGWATMTIQHEGLHVVVTAPYANEMDNGEWDHPEKVYEAEANAELIAEAFNVLNETGMTPRELANALSYLSGKVGSLTDTMPDEDDKRSDDEVLNDLANCRHIIDDIQAKLETFNTL
jgi:hypothetical protein